MTGPVSVAVVGLHGGAWFGPGAEKALRAADVLVGAPRHHDALVGAALGGETIALGPNLDEIIETCATRAAKGERVCVLAAGDPGFFGIVRVLGARLGHDALEVFPAPSSIALAFARVGVPWDDAVVISAHGRPLASAVEIAITTSKAAVLVSPESPPQALGTAALEAGCSPRHVWVCSRLGEEGESVTRTDLEGLAAGTFDPLSIVVLIAPGREVAPSAQLTWGAPEAAFEHRAGLITKAEVRAVVLGKLALPPWGVLWDVGAGSGSVAIEVARLVPGLRVFAVEDDSDACARIRANAAGTAVSIVEGRAPLVFEGLPDPDRAFVGGGGMAVLEAVLQRLRPGGVIVATYAVMASAVAACQRLGSLVQISVARGTPIGANAEIRLAAENPVFIVWGSP